MTELIDGPMLSTSIPQSKGSPVEEPEFLPRLYISDLAPSDVRPSSWFPCSFSRMYAASTSQYEYVEVPPTRVNSKQFEWPISILPASSWFPGSLSRTSAASASQYVEVPPTRVNLKPNHIITIPIRRPRSMSCGWQEVSDHSPDSAWDDLQLCSPAPSHQGNPSLKTTHPKSTQHMLASRKGHRKCGMRVQTHRTKYRLHCQRNHHQPAHKLEACQVTLYITGKITLRGGCSPSVHPLADARSVK